MTHSLHRTGSVESLKDDFVIIVRPAVGVNHHGAAPRVRRALEIIFDEGPANIGILETGHTMLGGPGHPQHPLAHGRHIRHSMRVLQRREAERGVRRLKEEELGLCVTVSGIVDDVFAMCDDVGLSRTP